MESTLNQEVMRTSREMSGWLKLVGIVSIVGGAITVLFTLGFGIIVAWLPIWQGVLLIRSSNGSKEVGAGNEDAINRIINPLKTYFIIQGVLILIGIFGWLIALLIMGFGGLADLLQGGSGIY